MDSTQQTREHQAKVVEYCRNFTELLLTQAFSHDDSKTKSPEKELFDIYSSKLKEMKYGSDEYKKCLKELQPALDHHYAVNRHHPEHFENGIKGMNLVDLVEFFCDNLAATKRMENGDIRRSLEINQERFGYSDDLKSIMFNTVELLDEGE